MPRRPSSSVLPFPQTRWQRIAAVIRRIIGAPDYDGYLAHMSRCHPGHTPLTASEFEQQRLEDRYSRPGSRCC